jgi:hypothetical protein
MEPARIAAWVSGAFAVLSLAFSCFGFGKSFDQARSIRIVQAIVLSVWIIGPPVWFWAEYFFIWLPSHRQATSQMLDEFKYGQDVAGKSWLGLVSALQGLYFGKDISPVAATTLPWFLLSTRRAVDSRVLRQGVHESFGLPHLL